MSMASDHPTTCVLIPYRDGVEKLAQCLAALMEGFPDDAVVLLIDDGTTADQSPLDTTFADRRIVRMRNDKSLGPAAARNRGIAWCREQGVAALVLLDSDCIPDPGFVAAHEKLHMDNPGFVCIGGAIKGIGRGFWAKFDCVASWFTSLAESGRREVGRLVHIPTTNMSFKLKELPVKGDFFSERLRTGEDVEFLRRLMDAGGRVLFSPTPSVRHQDREDFRGFMRHQYRWAVHTYAVRAGVRHGVFFRAVVGVAFFCLIPLYALASSILNVGPWMKVSPLYVFWWPLLYALYLVKGAGVTEGILFPSRALFPANGD